MEGIEQEIKSKILDSDLVKKMKKEIREKKREKLVSVMMAKSKEIMINTLIEGFQEYFPLQFSNRTIGSIYRSVLVNRAGRGYEIKIIPSVIILDDYKKRKIDSFWNETIEEKFYEDEEDETDDFFEEEDLVTEEENFSPYNNFERQGNIMTKEQLCKVMYNQAMKKIEDTFAGMMDI